MGNSVGIREFRQHREARNRTVVGLAILVIVIASLSVFLLYLTGHLEADINEVYGLYRHDKDWYQSSKSGRIFARYEYWGLAKDGTFWYEDVTFHDYMDTGYYTNFTIHGHFNGTWEVNGDEVVASATEGFSLHFGRGQGELLDGMGNLWASRISMNTTKPYGSDVG